MPQRSQHERVEPHHVDIQEGVVFGSTGSRDLRCDVFRPSEPNGVGVLLLHGGGYKIGDRGLMRGYGIQMARRGYACVSSEYRLSEEAAWPAQQQDVEAAIGWMQTNAESLGMDPGKFVLWGNSAGGHMALLLASRFSSGTGADVQRNPIAAAVTYYPITIYEPEMGRCWELFCPPMFPGGGSPEQWRDISPLTHVSDQLPPTLLLHGAQDDIVVASQSTRYFDALTKAGVTAELHVYAGQGHGFDFDRAFAQHTLDVATLFLQRYVPSGRAEP